MQQPTIRANLSIDASLRSELRRFVVAEQDEAVINRAGPPSDSHSRSSLSLAILFRADFPLAWALLFLPSAMRRIQFRRFSSKSDFGREKEMHPSEIAARFAAFAWSMNCHHAPSKIAQGRPGGSPRETGRHFFLLQTKAWVDYYFRSPRPEKPDSAAHRSRTGPCSSDGRNILTTSA